MRQEGMIQCENMNIQNGRYLISVKSFFFMVVRRVRALSVLLHEIYISSLEVILPHTKAFSLQVSDFKHLDSCVFIQISLSNSLEKEGVEPVIAMMSHLVCARSEAGFRHVQTHLDPG